jgi:predicted Fe-Mo cluster-binding NifX family protein
MKIAIPTKENYVDDHFSHSKHFTIFTIGDKHNIISKELVPSSEGCGCKSNIVHILSQKGVQIILAGNIGNWVVRVLNRKGIQVVRGCSGNVKSIVGNWLKGYVVDSGDACNELERGCFTR